jgi:hypothetical protein
MLATTGRSEMSDKPDWSKLVEEIMERYQVPLSLQTKFSDGTHPLKFYERVEYELQRAFVAGQESMQDEEVADAITETDENRQINLLKEANVFMVALMDRLGHDSVTISNKELKAISGSGETILVERDSSDNDLTLSVVDRSGTKK